MPLRHIRIAVVVIVVCVVIAANMSLKDRVVHYVLNRIADDSLEEVERDRLYAGALAGMTQTAPDFPYTCWLPPSEQEDYERELQGQIAGIGLFNLVKDFASGEFTFLPIYGTPASEAGLRYGDRIVKVNGEPVDKLTVWELVGRLRGEEGTKLSLAIRSRESQEHEETPLRSVEITRALIQQSIISGDRRNPDGTWNFTLENEPDIGYIRISQFADATVPEFMTAMATLESLKPAGVILDFRDNPGGFLPGAIEICEAFLKPGKTIVTTRYRSGSIKRQYTSCQDERFTMPLVILIDEGSASAAEIVAACLQDNVRAQVVGTRSYGKGTIQELFMLPYNMGLLRLTDASFWRPNGLMLHRKKTSLPTDVWGVSPNDGCDVPITSFQKMLTQLRRDVRTSLLPEEAALAIKEQNANLAQLRDRMKTATTEQECQEILSEYGFPSLQQGMGASDEEITRDDPTSRVAIAPESEPGSEPVKEAPLPDLTEKDVPLVSDATWTVTGAEPWRDPQLDRAVQVLRKSVGSGQ
ncbi:MAG: S41 family peptidase [Planctomycetia bacterium]|nr:S41 family peptidase [Planctomycetia bacterium]